MEKRLKKYISLLQNTDFTRLTVEERQKLRENLLVQIGFFQHERLIHLIVTITFALLTIISWIVVLIHPDISVFLLTGAFFALLIPYIRHYYILENGVQKLYEYYDKLEE
jgi:hypothetical protein